MTIPSHIDPNDHEALSQWMASDDFTPDLNAVHDAEPLRRVIAANDAFSRARDHLGEQARAAHEAGMSWTTIGAVLGTSRQAARQRFAEPASSNA